MSFSHVHQERSLQKAYSCDLSEAFPVQLVTLASSLKSDIAKLSSVKDLARLLIVDCDDFKLHGTLTDSDAASSRRHC